MKKKTNFIWVIVGIVIMGYFLYKIFLRVVTDFMLKNNTVHIKAVIINEKNYYPHSNVTHDFAYSYSFMVNGKMYTNNSHNSEMRVGDSIEIEYSKSYPKFNRSLQTTD